MGKIMKILLTLLAIILLSPHLAQAREISRITDWYVNDFQTIIQVQKDSSLLIEEKIVADCGNLPEKHGIFRILPLQTKTENGIIKTSIDLISITDFSGNKIPHSATTDNFNHTITFKIGDPNKAVRGENEYKITYSAKNAIRSQNNNFDELYWNLLGNFWDLEIDKFSTDIIFPAGINQSNSRVYLYSGDLGTNKNLLADYEWTNDNVLHIRSKQTLTPRQEITASVAFPKGIIIPHKQGLAELYGNYIWLLIPILVFILSFWIWNKYGKDPRVDKTVIPEFEIPENLTPMEMGIMIKNGSFSDSLITATIVDLAVKKHITIEDIPKKGIFGKQDFRLKKTGNKTSALNKSESIMIDKIFGSNPEILLSKLKNNFYKELPAIKKAGIENLKNKNLIYGKGLALKGWFIFLAMIMIFGGFAIIAKGNFWLAVSIIASAIIIGVFGVLMPKRTQSGAELNWRIKGFKLYMETAEIYRARFNEKENIFEKFLPYAIMFGITKLWIKKMEEIYGKEYFADYHPGWYVGTAMANFNADSFSSQISNLSSGITSNIGTTSGASGSGGAGGGGGGGGGGGW